MAAAMMMATVLALLNGGVDGVDRTKVLKGIGMNPTYYADQLFTMIPKMQVKFNDSIHEGGNRGGSQYLLASGLNAVDDVPENLKFTLSRGDQVKEYCWKNMKLRYYKKTQDCPSHCVNAIKDIKTKGSVIVADGKVHTELMYMYGNNGSDVMNAAAGNNRVVLLYSYYIPCSQLPIDSGYGECAGDMGELLAREAKEMAADPNRRQYFIVVYKKICDKSSAGGACPVGLATNECVSQLYMSMAGIPLFVANYTEPDEQDTGYTYVTSDYADYINTPHFQPFPRKQESRLQMVVDCLFQGDFLQQLDMDPDFPDLSNIGAKMIDKYNRVQKLLIIWYALQKRDEASSEPFGETFFNKVIQKLKSDGKDEAAKTCDSCRKYMACVPGIKGYPWADGETPSPQDLNLLIDPTLDEPRLQHFIEYMDAKILLTLVQQNLLPIDKDITNARQEIRNLERGGTMNDLVEFTDATAEWAGLCHHS